MAASEERSKIRAASASLVTNASLTALKLVAAFLTGSVSLLSEAAHSATDVIASMLTFASVKAASVPPDDEHPYGHGKVESLAGFAESLLLLFIVCFIVLEAIPRFAHPVAVSYAEFGLGVMALSSIGSLAVGIYVARVGRKHESIALKSNGQHLKVDFATSVGVLAALLITRYTGWKEADPVAGCLLAAWIARNAFVIGKEAADQLIDKRISDEDLGSIERILAGEPRAISYHRLRSRHSGAVHFVDIHVVVPREWSVVQAHELADELEAKIEAALAPAQVVIHIDPYDPGKVT